MNIYRIHHGLEFCNELGYVDISVDFHTWDVLNGKPAAHNWSPPKLYFIRGRYKCHFPAIGVPGGLVANQEAYEKLMPILKDQIEVLPLPAQGTQTTYLVLHVLTYRDCLDYKKSDIPKFKDGSYMFGNGRYHFKPNCIGNANIFRLPESEETFVTENFRQVCQKNNLRGLLFNKNAFVENIDL